MLYLSTFGSSRASYHPSDYYAAKTPYPLRRNPELGTFKTPGNFGLRLP